MGQGPAKRSVRLLCWLAVVGRIKHLLAPQQSKRGKFWFLWPEGSPGQNNSYPPACDSNLTPTASPKNGSAAL